MPRYITVTVGCDWDDCGTTGVEGDGNVIERTVTVDGKNAKAFLVCTKHSEALDDVLMPLMAKGVKVEVVAKPARPRSPSSPSAPVTTTGDLVCQECQRDDLKNKAGMAQHVIRSHGFESLAAYEAKYHVHID